MFEWRTASNAIYLGEDEGGKGRQFKARFLVPGLVKYDYGVCLLTKENADKFINGFTGCPVVINHQTVTDKNVKDVAVGDIFSVWFDEKDGYYWCNGILRDKEAIKLIDEGYSVSCQYLITEYSDNTSGKLHNGNPYDKIIENGKPEHLAIVNNPRYEGAIIAVNALLAENEDRWITIKPNGEENKGRHLLLKDGESPAEAVRRVYGDKNQKQLFDTKEYKKTKEDFKKEDEEKQKIFKDMDKKRELQEHLGIKDIKDLEDLSGEDITFEEWEEKQKDKKDQFQKQSDTKDGSKDISKEEHAKIKEQVSKMSDDELVKAHFESQKGYESETPRAGSMTKYEAIYGEVAQELKRRTGRSFSTASTESEIKEALSKAKSDKEEKGEDKSDDSAEKKYTWNDKKYSLKDLVNKGFIPTGYTTSIDGSKPQQYLYKTDGKKEYRLPVSDDDLKKIKEYQKEKEADDLKKAKEKSKDLTDYIKWQYSQDIEPHITRRVGDRTLVRWDDLPKETQSALKRLDFDNKINLEQYSGSEMSISVKDKKIIENLNKHRTESKATNSFIDQFKDTLYTALAEGIVNRLGE